MAEDNHPSLIAITCPPNEKRQPLPAPCNNLVSALKARFDQQDQDYRAAGGTPHRLTATQRWALDTIRDACKQTAELLRQTPETRERLTARAGRVKWRTVDAILARVPDVPPMPGDELPEGYQRAR